MYESTRDKKAFVVQVDNINDVDVLKNMLDDPIVNSNSKK